MGVLAVTLGAERQEPAAVGDDGGLATGTAKHARMEVGARAVMAEAGDCRVLLEEAVARILDGPTDAAFTQGMAGVRHEASEVVGAPDSGAVAPPQVGEARDGRGTAQRRGGAGTADLACTAQGAAWIFFGTCALVGIICRRSRRSRCEDR